MTHIRRIKPDEYHHGASILSISLGLHLCVLWNESQYVMGLRCWLLGLGSGLRYGVLGVWSFEVGGLRFWIKGLVIRAYSLGYRCRIEGKLVWDKSSKEGIGFMMKCLRITAES